MSPPTDRPSTLLRIFGERPDETVLKALFRGLIATTVVVLGMDLYAMAMAEQEAPAATPALVPGEPADVRPYLPSARPDVEEPARERRGRTPGAELREPMRIELVAGGRLEATGAITPGTAERLRAEIEKRGDYVKTVVLNSPGGSVQDALAMGRLIRERGLSTLVEKSAHCASSCPLVFAGGKERQAEDGASIGVHQVFAVTQTGLGDTGMDRAQRISAECQRHLVDMGVDPRVWIHAMETPREELFYFTTKELRELKLSTEPEAQKSAGR